MPVQGVNNGTELYSRYNNKNKKLISIKSYPDFDEYKYEVPASDGKKAGCALASLCIPGLGQMANGDLNRGVAFSAVAGLSLLGGLFAGNIFLKKASSEAALTGKRSATAKTGLAIMGAGYLVGLATWLYSAIDAYKTAKDELVEIRPKQKC